MKIEVLDYKVSKKRGKKECDLIIPFSILVIICLKYHIKQHEHLLKTYKFKVDNNCVSFYSESKLIEISIKQIISIEDKSFYYDFNGS